MRVPGNQDLPVLLNPRLWTVLALGLSLLALLAITQRLVVHENWMDESYTIRDTVRQARIDMDDAILHIFGHCELGTPCDPHAGSELFWQALDLVVDAAEKHPAPADLPTRLHEEAEKARELLAAYSSASPDEFQSENELQQSLNALEQLAAEVNNFWTDRIQEHLDWHQAELFWLLGLSAVILGPTVLTLLVTDRLRQASNRALCRSTAVAEFAVETMGGGFWEMDLTTGESRWSPRLKAMVGYGPDEIEENSKQWKALLHPDDADSTLADFERHLDGHTPMHEFTCRVRCKNGEYRWFVNRAQVIERDREGVPLRVIGAPQDITEHKNRELSIQEEADRQRILFEHAHDGIVILNTEGGVSDLNERFAQMIGYPLDEARTLHVWDWDPFITRDETLKRVTSDPNMTFETIHQRKDGSRYHVDIASSLLCWRGEHLRFCICRDITMRKQMEGLLRESEARLKLALGAGGMGVWEWKAAGDTLLLSDECCKICHLTPAPRVGEVARNYIHPADRGRMQAEFKLATKNRIAFYFELRFQPEDGQLLWLAVHGEPQYTADGALEGFIGLAHDISERRRTSEQLDEGAIRRRILFDESDDGVVLVDAEGCVRDVNQCFADMLGWSREELLSMHVWDWDVNTEERRAGPPLQEDSLLVLETRYRCKDGSEIEVEARCHKVQWHGEWLNFAVCRDITARKRMELALRSNEERLRLALAAGRMGVWEYTAHDHLISWSTEAATLLGLGVLNMPHASVLEAMHPEDRDLVRAAYRRCREERRSFHCEFRLHQNDGEASWFSIWGEGHFDPELTRMVGTVQDITARKLAQQAVDEEGDLRRLLFEESQDGIVVVAPDGGVFELNARFAEMLGYEMEEAARLNVRNWEAKLSLEQLEYQRDHDPDQIFETLHRRKDGSLVDVEVSANSVHWRGATYYFCVCRDISARKRMEASIRASEERLQLALRATRMGVWEWSVEHNSVYWSEEVSEILGVEMKNASPDVILQLFHPDDINDVMLRFQDAMECDTPFSFEYRVNRNDGTERWVSTVGRMIYEGDGRLIRAVGTVLDITERKQAENALRESEHRFATIFQGTPVSVAITCLADGRFLDVNPAFESVTGYSRDELIGRSVADLSGWIHPGDRLAIVKMLAENGRVQAYETKMRHHNGMVRNVQLWLELIQLASQPCVLTVALDVTEHRASLEALQESERRFRTLVDRSPEGIVILQDMKMVFVNAALVSLVGAQTREDLLDRPVLDIVPPDWHEHAREHIRQVFELNVPDPPEDRAILRLNGTIMPVELSQAPFVYEGRPASLVFLHDISERQESMRNIREEWARTEVLLKLHNEAAHLEDKELFDFALEKAVELTSSEIGFFHRLSEDQQTIILTTWNARALENCTASYETHYPIRAAGNWTDCVRSQAPVVYNDFAHSPNQKGLPEGHSPLKRFMSIPVVSNGLVKLLFGVGNKPTDYNPRDVAHLQLVANELHKILDQRAVQAALRESEQRFRDISEAADEFIWEVDAEDRFTYVSEKIESITGHNPAEVIGTEALNHVSPADYATVKAILDRIGDDNRPFSNMDIPLLHKDGHRIWLRTSGVPIRNPQGAIIGMRGVSLDITLQKNAEEERARLQAQLMQSQRMESVGRLAGGVAHDFNNILSVINGYTEMVLDELPQNSPIRPELQDIRKAGERAASLTRQLLAFSRKQVLVPRIMSLNRIVQDLHSMLRRLLGEDIELILELAADLGMVLADPGQIEQVIMNLAVNARDAMPDGGELRISTGDIPAGYSDAAQLSPKSFPAPHVMLRVADTGQGMSPQTLQNIFEPFFTTKERGRGTGLGLATVYGIVQQSGGEISVSSQLAKGTAFCIYLPRVTGGEDSSEDREEVVSERGSETILVVEDEEAVRFLAQRILLAAGYTVLSASTGQEALELLERASEQIDLLLTDVIMPGMNGRELALRVRQLRPEARILYMSGYTDDVIAHHGVLDEGANFINKPFETAALRRKVREVLSIPGQNA